VKFEICKKSWDKYIHWSKAHDKTCPYVRTGSAGGRTSFCFTPNGLFIEVLAKCACGQFVDITDESDI
jgi:hypothetical protein